MIKKILFVFILLTRFIFPQSDYDSLKTQLQNLLKEKFFDTTLASVDVYNLTKEEPVYSHNEKFLMRPASNMKILTTSAALYFLGPSYRFYTDLYYTGRIRDSVLDGDLYVVGGGDPNFRDSDLDSLIIKFKQLKIDSITGNLYGDVTWKDSLFWGNGWMWNDDPSTDAPYLSALDIDENSIGVFVQPTVVGQKAKVVLKPNTSYVKLINQTITLPEDSINNYTVDRDWIHRNNTITVKGFVQQKSYFDSSEAWTYLNIFDPAKYFLTLFKERLKQDSISFNGQIAIDSLPPGAIHLKSFSEPFDSIIVYLNKNSYNLGAEMTLYALSNMFLGRHATAKNGIKMIDSLISIIGMNPNNYRLVDGSGVSHYNLVSTELLVSVLKYFYYHKPNLYRILYNSFPIAGVDGTLKHRMENTIAQNNVHAKTGTLSAVSSLSGFVTAQNGDELAFSILMQSFSGSAKRARSFQDKICEILTGFK